MAAIGNEYGGRRGPAVAPHGVPGSTGIGDGLKFGNNNGRPGGKVAAAAVPRSLRLRPQRAMWARWPRPAFPPRPQPWWQSPGRLPDRPPPDLVVISKPLPEYTSEAKQLKVQGDVILRVTFTASGQVVVQGVVHGLGHGLDEEARRVAQQIRFRPATRNGQAVDMTTNITITFQLA